MRKLTRIQQLYSICKAGIFKKPSMVFIHVTERCNLNCIMCKRITKSKELLLQEWKVILLKVKKYFGSVFVIFSGGGEPLLRKDDLIELMKYSHQLGFVTKLTSNGVMIDQRLAVELLNTQVNSISISLDGIKEETHDFIRGGKGIYKKTIRGIKYLQEAKRAMDFKTKIYIKTVLNRFNIEEIIKLVNYVQQENLDGIGILPLAFQMDLGILNTFRKNGLWISREDKNLLKSTIYKLIQLKMKGVKILNPISQLRLFEKYYLDPLSFYNSFNKIGCIPKRLTIYSDGDISLCSIIGPIIGNVTRQSFYEIWKSKATKIVRRRIRNCPHRCLVNCVYEASPFEKIRKGIKLLINDSIE